MAPKAAFIAPVRLPLLPHRVDPLPCAFRNVFKTPKNSAAIRLLTSASLGNFKARAFRLISIGRPIFEEGGCVRGKIRMLTISFIVHNIYTSYI